MSKPVPNEYAEELEDKNQRLRELLRECRSDIETVNIYLKRIAKYQEGEIGLGMMSDEEKENARKWQKMLEDVLKQIDNQLEGDSGE